ncbi:MAG: tRNA (adenosine(37)-N6)-dimethylallyltransferase MiaA, partial [bacterium]|nr:tRNA (adenosine(37)-N6)-dimethylallyltransferase MiaA [bacterium]
SADSVALYRDMEIGTAKPGAGAKRRVPHHLIDIVTLGEHYSAVHYAAAADRIIENIRKRGRIPLVVGGTPLYLRSLLTGLLPGVGENHNLRRVLDRKSNEELMSELRTIDPVSADTIHPHDRKRLLRAIEIYRISGEPKSWHVARHHGQKRYQALKIGFTRARSTLHQRIDQRVEQMFESGLIDEVRGLMARGLEKHLIKVGAIGYKETIAYLKGQFDLEKTRALIKRRTKDFARRQMSQFRADKDIKWFSLDGNANKEVILKLKEKISGHFQEEFA